MKLKEITDRLSHETNIIIHDRLSEKGTVYEGKLLTMKTIWDEREVAWIKIYSDRTIVLEIE